MGFVLFPTAVIIEIIFVTQLIYVYTREHNVTFPSTVVTYVKSVSSLIISCLYISSSLSTCALSFDPDSFHAWSAPEAINALHTEINCINTRTSYVVVSGEFVKQFADSFLMELRLKVETRFRECKMCSVHMFS